MKRTIIKIDEEKCTGCGLCILSCAESALQIIDGKAKVVSEKFCDGLGACIGKCPVGALTVEEREAEEFDEKAARTHVKIAHLNECECPSAEVKTFSNDTQKKTMANALATLAMLITMRNFLKSYFFTPAIIVTTSVKIGTQFRAKIMVQPYLLSHSKLFL